MNEYAFDFDIAAGFGLLLQTNSIFSCSPLFSSAAVGACKTQRKQAK
jgi:hypothetical protein